MSYELLAWDSEFFGFPIGRISDQDGSDAIAHSVARADEDGIRCLYYLVAADHLAALHEALRHGFKPYDIRVEFERSLDASGSHDGDVVVRDAGLADERVLAQLAAQAITATRFTLDDHFPQDRIPVLYAEWVRRGLKSASARRVLLAEPAAGFVVCGLTTQDLVGTIELIGVAPNFTRRGISRVLMSRAHALMLEAGSERARVVTQGRNIAAQRLYQGLGYKTITVAWWLHRWRES